MAWIDMVDEGKAEGKSAEFYELISTDVFCLTYEKSIFYYP